jgi:hypothetical protein
MICQLKSFNASWCMITYEMGLHRSNVHMGSTERAVRKPASYSLFDEEFSFGASCLFVIYANLKELHHVSQPMNYGGLTRSAFLLTFSGASVTSMCGVGFEVLLLDDSSVKLLDVFFSKLVPRAVLSQFIGMTRGGSLSSEMDCPDPYIVYASTSPMN